MFCVHCGADGAVKFCAKCGKSQAIAADDKPREPSETPVIVESATFVQSPMLVESHVPWAETLDYAKILEQSEPRERIAAAGRSAENNLNGDDLLAIFDAVSPIGVSWSKLTGAIVPIFDKLGFHTSQQSQGLFEAARDVSY